jgi:(p)ppGpp synthase/HD superfamily hydrolase
VSVRWGNSNDIAKEPCNQRQKPRGKMNTTLVIEGMDRATLDANAACAPVLPMPPPAFRLFCAKKRRIKTHKIKCPAWRPQLS